MNTVFCRHVRVDGERCSAYAMRAATHCFFHSELNRRHQRLTRMQAEPALVPAGEPAILTPLNGDGTREPQLVLPTQPNPGQPAPELSLDLPPLEDAAAIQVAVSMVVSALGANRIDTRRASAILYGLQVASSNAEYIAPADPHRLVVDTITLPTGELLAPDVDPRNLHKDDVLKFRKYLASTAQADHAA
jgi:hypothetical protein